MIPRVLDQRIMPVIPDQVRRRLEQQYAPAQSLENHPEASHSSSSNSQQNIPERQAPTEAHPFGHYDPSVRALPKCPISEKNIVDSYVAFIMYCNPTIPMETDTTELRKIFQAPPKSDGKSFSTFVLYELIRKLEMKEIKTWAQLAIDLGVEPPALEKGQSAQKVQQYAVRLKRWMHAMHVDAFFEYILGKPHVYWTAVPSVNEPISDAGRDGVTPEEDLALRALLPETRPKRGRRKNEDKDDSDMGKSPSQRPRLGSPTLSEDFMLARASIMPENPGNRPAHNTYGQDFDDRAPWSATEMRSSLGINTFRWPPADSASTPLTAYPQSAITPTTRNQIWGDNNEPRSAVTPKSRSRRRHGPAVSSAWPSNGSSSSGKLRGRPPSNRSVTDGPFSTFPANPGPKDVPTINLRDNTPTATPVTANNEIPHFFPAGVRANPPNPPNTNGRPNRLQLQVPPREGGNVRLATPPLVPPVLLVNGEGNMNDQGTSNMQTQQFTPLMEYFNPHADLDPNFQHYVSIAFRQSEDEDRTNMDALESHFICEILGADWFDATGQRIERCDIDEANKICKQVIKNLKAESSSTETFLINLSALAGGPLTTRLRMTRLEQSTVSHYECHWNMRFGSIQGDFNIRATVHHGESPSAMDFEQEEGEATWKQRYLDLQQQIRERDAKVGSLKRGVLDALVASNQFASI